MIKLQIPSKTKVSAKGQRVVSSSMEKNRIKKCDNRPLIIKKNILGTKSKSKYEVQQKIISIVQQKTQPLKQRKKKQLKQQPQFLKQFEQITRIYKNSQDIQNEEDDSLLCLDETIDDNFRPQRRIQPLNSTINRYSEKSISQLPSIAEKDIEEQREDEIVFCHQKRIYSNLSTASNYQAKNTRNIKDKYINDFDLKLRGRSHQKRLAIDVQTLIKSRSKAKSSMSDQSGKRTTRY